MSSTIPKSKRSKSRLQVQHNIYRIRRNITLNMMETFGYSQKKFEAHIKEVTKGIKDTDERKKRQDVLRQREENFDIVFIEHERTRVLSLVCDISLHLRKANSIFPCPDSPSFISEWTERRLELTRAMECCNALQDELQYIAETLPSDKNKYTDIVLELEDEYKGIRALRQSDNRLLKAYTNT